MERSDSIMNRTTRFFLATLTACALLAGCGNGNHEASEQNEPHTFSASFNDATTTASVKIALAFEPGVRALDVHVHTRDGMVTLNGEVRSQAERQLATKVAEDVSGVRKVVNELQVRS
jgi:osmotically-inducible protein OsmY